MTKIPFSDVLVLLPGITGSALAKDGKEIWAPTGGAVLRSLLSFGGALKSLEVADDDWKQPHLGDGVTATRLMPDVHLLPGLWKIDGYGAVEKFLLDTFDLKENENYLPFPYDWRRDNRASARQLEVASAECLQRWRVKTNNPQAQLVLVGHSMGGLIARYFVECLEGWRDTRAVVTFGTPFYGSLNALEFLVSGFKKKFGPLSIDLSEMLQSLRSVHQLVPAYKCVYSGGVAATPAAAGIPGWKPAWATAAREMAAEVEAAAMANRADPGFAANPTVYRPIVGTDQPTRQSAVIDGDTVRIAWDRGGSDEQGDGTVPLLSAALAGTEDQRTFAPEQHARLQNYGSMLAHLKGVLSSLYQVRIDDVRSAATAWFSYRADDVYLPSEPVTVQLAGRSSVDESLLPEVKATLEVTDRATGELARRLEMPVPRTLTDVDLGPLPPGSYTFEARGLPGTASLSDVLVVAGPEDLDPPDAEPHGER